MVKYHENILKGFRVLGRTRFYHLTTMGGNSKTESDRVVFLVRNMPTQCPLHISDVS